MTLAPPLPADLDPAVRIERLERRLAREREARLAAEAIAEKGLLDQYRHQERLRLVETIARAANYGDDPADVFGLALREICAYAGWPTGHVCMFPDDDLTRLCSSGVWYGADDEATAPFRRASENATFVTGVGLPGRVLASRRAVWVEDVTVAPNFPRARAAAESGLYGAFAFPALIGDEVGAVLEFFQDRPAPPDPDMLEVLNQIGAQLGRVIERYRSARRLRIQNEELTRLFAEAQTQRAAAEAANSAKSAFLAVTSHEVRTPLNAVIGLSEALKREPLTPHQQELNDGVLASGQMLLRLLNAVLDMSRIEADQATARMTDFDMAAKLRAIISIWTPRAAELGVTLSLEDSELCAPLIHSDEGRIEQTLVNLISNALKFTPSGGEVTVVATGDGTRLRIAVVDGGPGVPETDRDRIFMPFEQTEAGREAGGAGLGLSICSGNIRLLGGEIGTDRSEAGASRFWFECPVAAARPVAPASETEEVRPANGLRILAAEDNPANRRVLEVLLAPAGIDLTLVENGLEAVRALERARFDLVLMDANMPVMDGPDAVRDIRARNLAQGAEVHMLTANAFADDVARYLAAGADGVLTKPIQLPQLFSVLVRCSDRVTAEHQNAA